MKKLIGITTNFIRSKDKPLSNGEIYSYVQAVEAAGGLPIMIPIYQDEKNVDFLVDRLDGLILSGGNDIHPYLYGADPLEKLDDVSLTRDQHESLVYQRAKERQIPILGICRGMQLINVLEGGDLYQDLATEHPGAIGHFSVHTVNDFHHRIHLETGLLKRIFQEEEIYVNSIHHQAVKRLGEGLEITAQAPDGIIEGLEDAGRKIYGVQFHPEELIAREKLFLEIFKEALDLVG